MGVWIKMSDADDRQVVQSHISNYLSARGFDDIKLEFIRVPAELDVRHEEVAAGKTLREKMDTYWNVIDRKFPSVELREKTLQLAEELCG